MILAGEIENILRDMWLSSMIDEISTLERKKKKAERKKKRKAIEGSLFDNFSEEMFDKLNQFH